MAITFRLIEKNQNLTTFIREAPYGLGVELCSTRLGPRGGKQGYWHWLMPRLCKITMKRKTPEITATAELASLRSWGKEWRADSILAFKAAQRLPA